MHMVFFSIELNKLPWRGGKVVTISPQYISQTCPQCDHVSSGNRKTQQVFRCIVCGYTENADLVAAMNILAAGHAVSACGEMVQSDRSIKQKPARVAA